MNEIFWNKKKTWGEDETEPLIKTVEEYNNLAKNIRQDVDWLSQFIALCKKYYQDPRFGCGGSLHIVLDDGNLEDSSVSWCAGYACAQNDGAGQQIADLMEIMTYKQREKIYFNYHLYGV